SWDYWNDERDKLARDRDDDYRYVGQRSYGVTDLSYYGSWRRVPSYGWVWRPAGLASGWAPYRDGRWANSWGWGWTWVSNEPWGWLPYHYGYWVYLTDTDEWVWVPSGFNGFWSPAPVTWYYYDWDNVSYVCWRPRPYIAPGYIDTDSPSPLVHGSVGQPVGRERPVRGGEPIDPIKSPKPIEQPIGRDNNFKAGHVENFDGGLTVVTEK